MTHPLLITQAEGCRRLKAAGLSESTAMYAVRRLPKHLDGLREKISARDIAEHIANIEDIYRQAAVRSIIRPIDDRTRARVLVK